MEELTEQAVMTACSRVSDFIAVQRDQDPETKAEAGLLVMESFGLTSDILQIFTNWLEEQGSPPSGQGGILLGFLIACFAYAELES